MLLLVQQCLLLLWYYYCVWRPPSDFLTFFEGNICETSTQPPCLVRNTLYGRRRMFPWQHWDLFSHRDAETLTSMLHPDRWQQICAAAYRIDLKPFWEVVCGLRCLPPPGGNQDTRASFRAISHLTTFYKLCFFFFGCFFFRMQVFFFAATANRKELCRLSLAAVSLGLLLVYTRCTHQTI